MTDSGDVKPDPIHTPAPPPAADDDTFKLAEEVKPIPVEEVEPIPAGAPGDMPGGPPQAAEWYTGSPGGQREGPFTLAEMKEQISAGTLTGQSLVWKDGMADWTPARSIGELFETPGSPPLPPPAAAAKQTDFTEYFQAADRLFTKPSFFRVTGRVCALLAVLVLPISMILWLFGSDRTWFTGAVLLALIFFVGEAAGAILGRIDAQSNGEETTDKPQ